MIKLLDKIILSDEVVQNFYHELKNNKNFAKWLNENLPEILDCENQQQNNPWHKYNVLGHILHSIEQMNKQTQGMEFAERRLLAYVMLFHDIGKPASHIVREKDGKMIDSFFNHNIKSMETAKKRLHLFGFSEEEIGVICKLVYKHDIFMFIKDFPTSNPHWRRLSDKLMEEEIEDLSEVGDGEKLLKYLIMVGRADNLAQNEKMTGESLAMLDKFDNMLEAWSEINKQNF